MLALFHFISWLNKHDVLDAVMRDSWFVICDSCLVVHWRNFPRNKARYTARQSRAVGQGLNAKTSQNSKIFETNLPTDTARCRVACQLSIYAIRPLGPLAPISNPLLFPFPTMQSIPHLKKTTTLLEIWGPIHWITKENLKIGPVKTNFTEARLRASVKLVFVIQWIDA